MPTENKKKEVEELKKDKDVKRALEQTAGSKKQAAPKVAPAQKFWLGTYLLLLLILGAVYFALRFDLFNLEQYAKYKEDYAPLLQRSTVGTMAIVMLLMISKAIKIYLIDRLSDNVARFNLKRVTNLLAGIVIIFIIISILFANWYTAVVSFGLISLILGFALQTPITSFIGWIYILVKVPYRVGDRIKIGEASGDVIDVGYLDTTLWEFGGQYLSTDHPSGRIIKFPNSNVLNASVYNYSWALFPYIWNEVKFQIGYQSDLQFVADVMQKTAEEEVGEQMMERIGVFRELLAQTPVDQLEVRARPSVVFRVADNTWIEAIVRYLVEPKNAGRVKTQLIKKMLEQLNAEPEKVLFPKGDMR